MEIAPRLLRLFLRIIIRTHAFIHYAFFSADVDIIDFLEQIPILNQVKEFDVLELGWDLFFEFIFIIFLEKVPFIF